MDVSYDIMKEVNMKKQNGKQMVKQMVMAEYSSEAVASTQVAERKGALAPTDPETLSIKGEAATKANAERTERRVTADRNDMAKDHLGEILDDVAAYVKAHPESSTGEFDDTGKP